ncbi:MAG: hypothetical protein U9R17_00070 [Thermodesulfobacteriota bacterium]|nr:hypothetical protein [Thermodesulfobacteriota bacterium]
MNKNQRENTAKYLYDISKGIALVVVVGNIIKDQWNITTLFLGLLATLAFFGWAYIIDGGSNK